MSQNTVAGDTRALEALFFVSDEPLTASVLAQALDVDRRTVEARCDQLARDLEERGSGLVLRNIAGGWRLYTHPDAAPIVEQFVLSSRQARLTKASLVTLSIVAFGIAGGWLATQSAVEPIRRLTRAVQRIVRTGQTDERVPVDPYDDDLQELTALFNDMLDRIEGLVAGMRGALDNVSHDLRTPLTRLRGSAEMALAAQPDLDRYREALADCVEEADHVLVMLNALMDISEAESGAMPLKREPVRLADVAERAVDLYRDVADVKGVALSADTSCDVPVVADRVRLEQVAANLLDNAVKYTPPGGRVRVDVQRTGGRALLRVSDTGPGIPAEELPHIWERLFRGDTSRTERGLGLGLSLVKAIVQAHGGTVDVTSATGQGSTFIVSLPV